VGTADEGLEPAARPVVPDDFRRRGRNPARRTGVGNLEGAGPGVPNHGARPRGEFLADGAKPAPAAAARRFSTSAATTSRVRMENASASDAIASASSRSGTTCSWNSIAAQTAR
jgi:hypothetical protein